MGVLKNVRAGIMPPADKPQPSDDERRLLEDWIKYGAFGIDPKDPDPGRVTVRRLNRVEYRNTIRDLIGVDFDTDVRVPAGRHGARVRQHRRRADALAAAAGEVPRGGERRSSRRPCRPSRKSSREKVIPGRSFGRDGGERAGTARSSLSYYEPATVSATVQVEHAGRYQLVLDLTANERYVDGVNRLQQSAGSSSGPTARSSSDAGLRPAGREAVPLRVRSRLEGRAARR